MSLLEVRDLHVWFKLAGGRDLHAVRGVRFQMEKGERFGLVGESGSGKTTTILALMGLLPPNAQVAGEVVIDGRELLAGGERGINSRRWTDVAMVFQGAMNALNPVRTIAWQLIEPMELHGTASGHAARTRVGELLELVGMPATSASRYPHELSGGMRQRVAIAMALACDPKVLLADEPTTALDVMIQAQILELLTRLSDELGLALLLVTHDLPVVAQVCDRAAVMYAGELAEYGPVDELVHAPAHPYTRLLFAATPDLRRDVAVVSIPGVPPRLDRPIVGCPFQPRCDRAFDRCRETHPVTHRLGVGRAAACHLLDDDVAPTGPAPEPSWTGPRRTAATKVRPSATTVLLEVDAIETSFPVRRGTAAVLLRQPRRVVKAVDGVSLRLDRGEMLALVGESGSGKTTTAHTIMRTVDPAHGRVVFDGHDLTHLSHRELRPLRRRLQMIYQDPYESLDPRARVSEIVVEALRIHRIERSRAARSARVLEVLERVGLTPAGLYADRYPHELSGGQRQRVAIAASLALDPDVLVADEPVSMLDVSVRVGILALLDGLRRDNDMGVLMITHDLSTAAHFADRIAVMYLGRIVEEGPAKAVIDGAQHPYTRALLSVVPSPDPRHHVQAQILRGETPNPANIPSGCRFHPRCPMAQPVCASSDPELHPPTATTQPGHRAACLFV